MSRQPIEAAVFDIGGVLIDWNPRHLYRKIFDDSDKMERFLEEICTSSWHAQHDFGRRMSETTAELIVEHPTYAAEIRAYSDRFPEMWSGPIEPSVEILEQLQRKGLRTYAATNWSDEFWPVVVQRFPFLGSFDGALVSGDIGICKTDVAFYRQLIDQFELNPHTTLYIDDSSANVAAATELGFISHLFESPSQLRTWLTSLEVL